MSDKSESKARRAKNEALFRNRNEEILRLSKVVLDRHARNELPLNFVCECSNTKCRDRLVLTAQEYIESRGKNNQFIIKVGHEHPDIERPVRRIQKYEVVEKQIPVPPTNEIAPI